MAKPRKSHVCSSCGHAQVPWFAQCPSCGEYSTAVEQAELPASAPRAARALATSGQAARFEALEAVSPNAHARSSTGVPDLDRVLGGGLVPGSFTVISAEPGAGKSTLASQVLAKLARAGRKVALVAAEESAGQVKLRFDRLGESGAGVAITQETAIERVIEGVLAAGHELVVVDSIQTVYSLESPGTPGSVGQVRECGQALMRLAKEHGVSVFLIGQVTKDGNLAGPRMLEHMVDVVLSLEGDRDGQFRVLRAVKNRFGSTDEIGVFTMTGAGLEGVDDPSAAFITRRSAPAIGSVLCPVIEGSRPILVEVQALATPSNLQQPIRACRGIAQDRFRMLMAVLSRRCNLRLSTYDIYLNLGGGLKVEEPSLDLACCLAVASAYADEALPAGVAAAGEVTLLGEVRVAPQIERRRAEVARLGYGQLLSSDEAETVAAALAVHGLS